MATLHLVVTVTAQVTGTWFPPPPRLNEEVPSYLYFLHRECVPTLNILVSLSCNIPSDRISFPNPRCDNVMIHNIQTRSEIPSLVSVCAPLQEQPSTPENILPMLGASINANY